MRKFRIPLIFAAALAAAPAPVFGQAPGSVSLGGGLPGVPYAGLSWYLIGFELGPWEDYLIAELTPELAVLEPASTPRISWISSVDDALLPEFAAALLRRDHQRTRFIIGQHWQEQFNLGAGVFPNGNTATMFQRRIVTSGISRRVGDNGAVAVSAVLASQQFGHSMLDLDEWDRAGGPVASSVTRPTTGMQPYNEVSHGTGLRLAMRGEMMPGLSMEAAIQSRIGMESFAQYRGVYAQPAELDIPGRAQLGVEFRATERSALSFAVSQVFYSDVAAFPSRALPARFFALLGDSTSPEFAWKDLTVYTLGWRWERDDGLSFHLDYSTRSQPEPSAPSLASALEDELGRNAWLAGVSKRVNGRGELELSAAYAPPEYAFGGNVFGVLADELDPGLEVQARWRWAF